MAETKKGIKKVVYRKCPLGEIRDDDARRFVKGFSGEHVRMEQFKELLDKHYGKERRTAEHSLHERGIIGYALMMNHNIYRQSGARQLVKSFLKTGSIDRAHELSDALVYAERSAENLRLYEKVIKELTGKKRDAKASTKFKAGISEYRSGKGIEAAVPHIKAAMRHNPKDPTPYFALADMLYHEAETISCSPQLVEAEGLVGQALKLNPDNPQCKDLEKRIQADRKRGIAEMLGEHADWFINTGEEQAHHPN